jgi:mRNA interferase MazF
VRDYTFEAMLPDSASFRGVVLADQPRSISWEVRERLAALLGID